MLDPFLGRLGEVIIAARTNALVLGELDFVDDLLAARAFLEKSLGNIAAALFSAATTRGRSLENCHVVIRPGPRWPHERKSPRRLSARGRIRSGLSRWLIHRQSKAPASLARPGFFVN